MQAVLKWLNLFKDEGEFSMAYTLLSTTIECENKSAVCYGIECGALRIPDISFDKDLLLKEIDKYNKLELAPEHVYDAIDNFLVVQYG